VHTAVAHSDGPIYQPWISHSCPPPRSLHVPPRRKPLTLKGQPRVTRDGFSLVAVTMEAITVNPRDTIKEGII
jgi:hypothetical protein